MKNSLTAIDNIQKEASSLPSLLVPDDPADMILDAAGLSKRKPKGKAVDKLVYEGKGKNTAMQNKKPLVYGTAGMTSPY